MTWTDDPLRDFLRYDARRAQEDAARPHCDECGCPIWDDYAYRVEGRLFCVECMEQMKVYLDDD